MRLQTSRRVFACGEIRSAYRPSSPHAVKPSDMRMQEPNSPPAATPPALLIQGVGKTYGEAVALRDIDLRVEKGEFLTLLGASGSGKTTLLNIVSGLIPPTTGSVHIDGIDCTRVAPHRRDIGVIFQNYSLFPHLTVSQNLAFPLEMRRFKTNAIDAKVADALALVDLSNYGDRLPAELSGGQQQRVALARCLIYKPALILMDEPLAALDRRLRDVMQGEIRRLHRETGATIIFVTHDQDEALAMSDRICLMDRASVIEIATPREIYDTPRTAFAAGFIGASNLIAGRIDESGLFHATSGLFTTPVLGDARNRDATILVRPEHIGLVSAGAALVAGQVVDTTYSGAAVTTMVRLNGGASFIVRDHAHRSAVRIGETVGLHWRPEHARPLFQ